MDEDCVLWSYHSCTAARLLVTARTESVPKRLSLEPNVTDRCRVDPLFPWSQDGGVMGRCIPQIRSPPLTITCPSTPIHPTHTLCVSHADFFLCCFSCCTYTPTETGRSLHSKPETLSRWILGATLTVTLR
jgi:hypothetical protein